MDKPNWERGDTIKSIYGVFATGRVALARFISNIAEYPSKLDTKYANAPNTPEDE